MANLPKMTPVPSASASGFKPYDARCEKVLNDEVAKIIDSLFKDETFLAYIRAVEDEDSVEGTTYIDDIQAASMVRDAAIKAYNPVILDPATGEVLNLKVLRRAMNAVLNRRFLSRAQRRHHRTPERIPNPTP